MKKKIVSLVLLMPILLSLVVIGTIGGFVPPENIAVTGITLSTNLVEFSQLSAPPRPVVATVLPYRASNRTVVWSSMNPEVAKFDMATQAIIPNDNGITYIVATTVDGGHRAEVQVRVNSHDIHGFVVTFVGTQPNEEGVLEMYRNQTIDVQVRVQPSDALAGVPRINSDLFSATTMQVVSTSPELLGVTYQTTLTALSARAGFLDVEATSVNGTLYRERFGVNISPRLDENIGLIHNGLLFYGANALVIGSGEVPLVLNRPSAATFTLATTSFATIVDDILIFTAAGTVRVDFIAAGESGYAMVQSTMGVVDFGSITVNILTRAHNQFDLPLADLDIIEDIVPRNQIEIQQNITPADFHLFYEIEFDYNDNRVHVTSLSYGARFFITPSQAVNETITIVFLRKSDKTVAYSHTFQIWVSEHGPDAINFNVNNPLVHDRGLERRFVVGNKDHLGFDYFFDLEVTTLGVDYVPDIYFEIIDCVGLATVDQSGGVTFDRNFDFDGELYIPITVRATSNLRSVGGNFATQQFTFYIADAYNIRDNWEFGEVSNYRYVPRSIVLHGDITLVRSTIFDANIFGNGHRIDATTVSETISNDHEIMIRLRGYRGGGQVAPTIATNVEFVGNREVIEDFSNSKVQASGVLIRAYKFTTIQYSQLRGATRLLDIPVYMYLWNTPSVEMATRDVHIRNSVFRQGLVGVFFGNNDRNVSMSNIVLEDLIFEHLLIGVVTAFSSQSGNQGQVDIIFRGFMRFYLWYTADEFGTLNYTVFMEGQPTALNATLFNIPGHDYEGIIHRSVPIATLCQRVPLMNRDTKFNSLTLQQEGVAPIVLQRTGAIPAASPFVRSEQTVAIGTIPILGNASARVTAFTPRDGSDGSVWIATIAEQINRRANTPNDFSQIMREVV
ncbi:MAG: hypothetical protein FWE31_03135 [Firmicutes bacterium]|nr:hypothetical protein [Bacillota bacterium]